MSMSDKIFGSYTTQNRSKIREKVDAVMALESSMRKLSNEELKRKTVEFRKRLENGETESDIMIEAFAVCREASRRTLGMSHYKVQIEAAIAMQDNTISEMKTGEGKTLVQTLTAYLNAISGKGVHVITANDYLAQRDAEKNRPLFEFLGLSCGHVAATDKMKRQEKRSQYKNDIVYATASTIAFDYLRDNQVLKKEDRVLDYGKPGKSPLNYAVVDEVDSILLDDGATPLILSGHMPEEDKKRQSDLYEWAIEEAAKLDCVICDKESESDEVTYRDCVIFKDTGNVLISDRADKKLLGGKIYEKLTPQEQLEHMQRITAIKNCIIALHLYKKDKDYQLLPVAKKEGFKEVVLVDKGTSRLAIGRRLMEGRHEAIEAKEKREARLSKASYDVEIQTQAPISATCTYPDFFGTYTSGISGMTGTSNQEDFIDIYGLPTYEVPSRKTNIRVDEPDEMYVTNQDKYKAIIDEVIKARETLQPVLIGTVSVEESNLISKMLAEAGIRHQLLNAVKTENEAGIVENAGLLGKVTVATNMAGRGTDIKLGPGVEEVGGLYVIGTTKNRNTRIDNQLRGRAGRQGDPGKTKFYCSLEDEYIRLNGGLRVIDALKKAGMGSGKISLKSIQKYMTKCQTNQEGADKELRITSEKIGQVLTTQKKSMYDFRTKVLECNSVADIMTERAQKYVADMIDSGSSEELLAELADTIDTSKVTTNNKKQMKLQITELLVDRIKSQSATPNYEENLKTKILKSMNDYWTSQIEYLQTSRIGTFFAAGVSQKDPFEEYKTDAMLKFKDMVMQMHEEFIAYATHPNLAYGEYTPTQKETYEHGVVL